ncbi:hypothetical protein PA598K_01472 [Paenibacillus sp. 598K]|nr:hypothetical protein PA598K_01472 [Paenibacillus sp. 598K]
MHFLAVTLDAEGKSGIINVKVSDVTHLESDSPTMVAVHTSDRKYFVMGSIKYFTGVLEASGYEFFLSDKGTLVNLNYVIRVDTGLMILHLSNGKKTYYSRNKKDQLLSTLSLRGI